MQILTHKLEGQAYMKARGCRVPEAIMHLDHIRDLPDFTDLPAAFVVKPCYASTCQNVFLVRDGHDVFSGRPITRKDVQRAVGQGFDQPFLIEELLTNWDDRPGAPLDYKFHCYGDHMALLVVIERNSIADPDRNRVWYLDEAWRPLPFDVKTGVKCPNALPEVPPCYPEMLAIATAAARDLNMFVSVDMYATPEGPAFGEFTPYPSNGYGLTPVADAWLGGLWKGEEGGGDAEMSYAAQ